MWGHIWNVLQSVGLFAHGESLAFVRNQPAESFHFLLPDGSSPNLRKTPKFASVTSLLLLFDRLAVMKVTRWTRLKLLWTPRQEPFYTSTCLTLDLYLVQSELYLELYLCVTSGNLRGWRGPMGHGRGQVPHGSVCEEPETSSSRYPPHVITEPACENEDECRCLFFLQCLTSIERFPEKTSRTALRGRCPALWKTSSWP